MNRPVIIFLKYALPVLIVSAGIFLVVSNIDGSSLRDSITEISSSTLIKVSLSMILLYVVRGIRIHMISGIPFGPSFRVAVKHTFLSSVVPFKLGEYSYVSNMVRHGNSHGGSFGELVSIRSFDFLVLGIIASFGVLSSEPLLRYVGYSGIVVAAACLSLFIFREKISSYLHSHFSAHNFVSDFIETVSMIDMRSAVNIFIVSAAMWCMSFVPWLVLLLSMYDNLETSSIIIAWVLSTVGSSLPNILPAGIGSVHAGWVAGLSVIGFSLGEAAIFATLAHGIVFMFSLLLFVVVCLYSYLTGKH